MGASEREASLWKTDHDNAMRVFDCEDLVNRLYEIFDRIDALHRTVVDQVVSGKKQYSEDFESKIKELCKDWQVLAADVMSTATKHQKNGYDVKNRNELEDRINRADESSKLNFDTYALKKIESIKLPIDKLKAFQTPVLQWPE